jgi:hypothetical protein
MGSLHYFSFQWCSFHPIVSFTSINFWTKDCRRFSGYLIQPIGYRFLANTAGVGSCSRCPTLTLCWLDHHRVYRHCFLDLVVLSCSSIDIYARIDMFVLFCTLAPIIVDLNWLGCVNDLTFVIVIIVVLLVVLP